MENLKLIIKKQEELIKAHISYEKILSNEINDLIGVAYVHGWESSRVNEGKIARENINKINNEISELKGKNEF